MLMDDRAARVSNMVNRPDSRASTSEPSTPLPTTENPLATQKAAPPRPLTEKEKLRKFVQARVGLIPVKGGLKSRRRRTRRRRSRKSRRNRK